jgi:hypothetical protein
MTLRHTTLANAANRRRFVCEASAQPYLLGRERANARRDHRQARQALALLASQTPYGSGATLAHAVAASYWVTRLLRAAQAVAKAPTPKEEKTPVLSTSTDRLAAN